MNEINETYRAVGRRLAQMGDEVLHDRLAAAARRYGNAEVNFAISFVGDASLALDLLERFYPVPRHKVEGGDTPVTAANHDCAAAVSLTGSVRKAADQASGASPKDEAMPLRLNSVPIAGWAVWDRPEANPTASETMTVRLIGLGRDGTSAPRHINKPQD